VANSTKELAELKAYLEKKLEELRQEEKLLETMIKLVNEALGSSSFVKASELVQRPTEKMEQEKPAPSTREEKPIEESLITAMQSAEKLARVIVYPKRIEIVFLKDFNINTPPFQNFFVRRLLEGFKRQDEDLIARGEKSPDEIITYNIEEEGGTLKRIIIENYGDKGRIREIKGSLRWTLNRMLERT